MALSAHRIKTRAYEIRKCRRKSHNSQALILEEREVGDCNGEHRRILCSDTVVDSQTEGTNWQGYAAPIMRFEMHVVTNCLYRQAIVPLFKQIGKVHSSLCVGKAESYHGPE